VVAAGRSDALRSAYGHWTRDVRRSRLGLALCPEPEDGELLGATFPRRDRPAPSPGRGYLVVDGLAEVLQVARP
jgi:DNA segregation ATPase FtsK/SpoIIIE, S-DNA-T family